MGKKESPKEWQQGDVTEEELARILQPIGAAPEPLHDDSEVLVGAAKFKDEREDAFLDFTEKQRVWEMLSKEMGPQWQTMERADKEKMAKKYTANIITEAMTVAGGSWGQLSTDQKRDLFHRQLIDKTVAPEGRQEAFEDKKKEEFPDMDLWFLKNRHMMEGMNRDERTALYKVARSKWEKANKK